MPFFPLFLRSGTVLAETSKKNILKQMPYNGKLQVEPFQCDSFKSNGKAEAFLQGKKKMLNAIYIVFTYKT